MDIAAVEILVWFAIGSPYHMQDVQGRIDLLFDVHTYNVQPRQFVQLFQVIEEGIFNKIAGDVTLQ